MADKFDEGGLTDRPEDDADQAESELEHDHSLSAEERTKLIERVDALKSRAEVFSNIGCIVPLAIAGFAAAAILSFYLWSEGKPDCSSAPRRDGLELIACTNSETASSASSAESSSDASATDSATNSSAPGGGTAGNVPVPPPDPATLPPGAVLYKGESGDQIGYIFQDGQPRYLALDHPGVTVGLRDASAIAIAIGPGKVTSFGANLHTGTNNGRYGINLYRVVKSPTADADSDFRAGCALEIGQTSCRDPRGTPIVEGDKVAIVIGEAGNPGARGDYTMDWWFVYQPS